MFLYIYIQVVLCCFDIMWGGKSPIMSSNSVIFFPRNILKQKLTYEFLSFKAIFFLLGT